MTLAQKIHFSSICNLTVNRGVEARGNVIVNNNFDPEGLSSSRALTECSEGCSGAALAAGDPPTQPLSTSSTSDRSGSFVKVVVHKRRRSAARLPLACSPSAVLPPTMKGGENSAVPAAPAVLLACPAFAALHKHSWEKARTLLETSKQTAQPLPCRTKGDASTNTIFQNKISIEERAKTSFWKRLHELKKQNLDTLDNGPDSIEVYHFDRTNDYLCARDAAGHTRVDRAARLWRRPATALLAESLAIPRILLALPVAIMLQIQRCVLLGIRSAMTGVVQTASDQFLKPSLALAFNAVLQPPLVLLAQTTNALRDVLRPLTLALADALEPFARLLSSLRIINIERQCTCTQQV